MAFHQIRETALTVKADVSRVCETLSGILGDTETWLSTQGDGLERDLEKLKSSVAQSKSQADATLSTLETECNLEQVRGAGADSVLADFDDFGGMVDETSDSAVSAAEALCPELEQLAQQSEVKADEIAAKLKTYQTEFGEVGDGRGFDGPSSGLDEVREAIRAAHDQAVQELESIGLEHQSAYDGFMDESKRQRNAHDDALGEQVASVLDSVKAAVRSSDSTHENAAADVERILGDIDALKSGVLEPVAQELSAAKTELDRRREQFDTVVTDLEAKLDVVEAQIKAVGDEVDKALALLEDETQEAVDTLKNTIQEPVESMRAMFSDSEDQVSETKSVVLALFDAVQSQMDGIQQNGETFIDTLESVMAAGVSALDQIPATGIPTATASTVSNAITQAADAVLPQFTSAASAAAQQIGTLSQAVSGQIGTISTQSNGQIESFLQMVLSQMDTAYSALESQISTVETQVTTAVSTSKDQVLSIVDEAISRVEALQEGALAQAQTVQESISGKLSDLESQMTSASEGFRTRADSAVSAVVEVVSLKETEIEAALAQASTALATRESFVRTQLATTRDAAKAEASASVMNLRAGLNTLSDEHATTRDAIRKSLEARLSELSGVMVDLDASLDDVKRQAEMA